MCAFGEIMTDLTLFSEFIQEQRLDSSDVNELLSIFNSILSAAKKVREALGGGLDLVVNTYATTKSESNVHGEIPHQLDHYANEIFKASLAENECICGVLSEEDEHFIEFATDNSRRSQFIVALDPIDGSSNIEMNIPVGTIFSIFKRTSSMGQALMASDFLQSGRTQVAAGYILYGASTTLVYTTGNGVNGFTYEPKLGDFYLSHPGLSFPESGKTLSIGEGNAQYFSDGLKNYLAFCKRIDKSRARPYRCRYVGSLVADFHRNLLTGGVYLYPQSSIAAEGKLRLIYECSPLAFIAEQAGGLASDGKSAILGLIPNSIHQRSPLIIGSKSMVEEALSFLHPRVR